MILINGGNGAGIELTECTEGLCEVIPCDRCGAHERDCSASVLADSGQFLCGPCFRVFKLTYIKGV